MLAPEDRRLYSACFAVPSGYAFDAAVGTTYSLDLESLLFALFCLATSSVEEPEVALGDPVSLLESIHRVGRQVTVFCHAGETSVPRRPQALYGLLEPCLVPALGRAGAIFHPKLWLFRFRHPQAEPLLRAVVLSRNLTASRAWDTFVCLEGSPGTEPVEASRDLSALLSELPRLAPPGHSLSADRAAQLALLAAEVARTRFAAPPPFEGTVAFEAIGIGNERGLAPHPGDRVLALSPFVSPDTLTQLRLLAPRATLVGRAEELAKCGAEVVGAWEAFTLHQGASSDAELQTDDDREQVPDAAPRGLHAKALAVELGPRTTWWLGSGNLTDPVRTGRSVELLVRLEGKSSAVGIEAFLDSGFRPLLEPYQHAAPVDDPADGNRSLVGRAQRELADTPFSLCCEAKGEQWDVVLQRPATGSPLAVEGVTISCRLLTLGPSRELRWTENTSALRFEGLSMEALTAFVAFRLTAGQEETRFELCFTLKFPITGLPPERDARISRSIIKDRAAFMSYLRCLLDDLGGGLAAANAVARDGETGFGSPPAAASTYGLLEALLKTLHREPQRLQALRSLIEQAARGTGEPLPMPDEFRELWAAVEPHLALPEAAQ